MLTYSSSPLCSDMRRENITVPVLNKNKTKSGVGDGGQATAHIFRATELKLVWSK